MVTRNDLVRGAIAGVEQNEVFHNIQQALTIQHAGQQDGQQRLILRRFGVVLIQPLPAIEMLLAGGDGAVLGVVAV
ncbi:hypothetical protein D9M71_816400 [compost metagenome]